MEKGTALEARRTRESGLLGSSPSLSAMVRKQPQSMRPPEERENLGQHQSVPPVARDADGRRVDCRSTEWGSTPQRVAMEGLGIGKPTGFETRNPKGLGVRLSPSPPTQLQKGGLREV